MEEVPGRLAPTPLPRLVAETERQREVRRQLVGVRSAGLVERGRLQQANAVDLADQGAELI